jgi:cation:H+ antiporter
MIVPLVMLVFGFIVLVKGAGYLVDGSASLAKSFGVSGLIIGLTVVAFGTSAPELVVNLTSAFKGSTDLALGNIIGSNIANIFLVLGICAMIYPLKVQKSTAWRQIPFALLASVLLVIFAQDVFIDGLSSSGQNIISRSDGFAFLGFFIIFIYYIYGMIKSGSDEVEHDVEVKDMVVIKSIGYVLIGLIGLVIGGSWIVDSAVSLAGIWGVSQSVIGLTIVAIGTSLPELATSVVAAMKRQADMAVGNIVGSNIFNIFWILGVTSIISPLPLKDGSDIDLLFMLMSASILFAVLFIGKKMVIQKYQGALFLLSYIVYIAMFFIR